VVKKTKEQNDLDNLYAFGEETVRLLNTFTKEKRIELLQATIGSILVLTNVSKDIKIEIIANIRKRLR